MMKTQAPPHRADVELILAHVKPPALRGHAAALTVLVGLPAAGKTHVAEELRTLTGAATLESDALRHLLFPRRTYSPAESRRLFAAIHEAIDELLSDGVSVVLDATNLREAERAPLYEIAERRAAALILVQVTAPDALIRERLARRESAGGSLSEADTRVYARMLGRAEAIQRPHHVVDTSQDTGSVVAAIAKEMQERE
ncbi:MAG: ATP-binding protein [Dehalococcoidia bacterium]